MTRSVAVPAAASKTGAERRKRSWDTQTWSKPAPSAATASFTKVETVTSLFSRRLVRSGKVVAPTGDAGQWRNGGESDEPDQLVDQRAGRRRRAGWDPRRPQHR